MFFQKSNHRESAQGLAQKIQGKPHNQGLGSFQHLAQPFIKKGKERVVLGSFCCSD
jgi:hypothetical protein